jgi:hypothetical protein
VKLCDRELAISLGLLACTLVWLVATMRAAIRDWNARGGGH